MPKISRFFALPVFAGALAISCWGQGAVHEGMSFLQAPSYDGVERAVMNPKTNHWESQRGWLMFDPTHEVKFVTRSGNQLAIPYKAIRELEFSFYNPIPEASPSRAIGKIKLGGKRYLTVKFDNGAGLEHAVLTLEADQYQQVIGSFQSKTGHLARYPGGYEKHW